MSRKPTNRLDLEQRRPISEKARSVRRLEGGLLPLLVVVAAVVTEAAPIAAVPAVAVVDLAPSSALESARSGPPGAVSDIILRAA